MPLTKISTITNSSLRLFLAEASENCEQFGVFDTDLSEQLSDNVTVAEKVRESFDSLWDNALSTDSFVYWTLADIGLLLALVTVIVFTMRWGRELLESGVSSKSFGEIIWPMIVAVLLSNNGYILSNLTIAMRDYVQEQEEVIVRRAFLSSFFEESLESAFRQLVGVTTVPLGIGSILAQCTSSENPIYCLAGEPIRSKEGQNKENQLSSEEEQEKEKQQKKDFHPGALQQAICALEPYKDSYDDTGNHKKLAELHNKLVEDQQALRNSIKEFSGNQSENDSSPPESSESKEPVGAIPPAVYKLMSASEDSGLMQFFMGSGAAFVWLTELALFLTALLGPLAVGLSLLPVGNRAIFAWLTGFLSIAFAKLFYFILTGLSSLVVLNAVSNVSVVDFVDSVLIGIFIGALAPLLSLAVCVSGGRAVFQSLSNYVNSAVGGVPYRARKY